MKNREFAELCQGAACMLESLAKSAAGWDDTDLKFNSECVAEVVNPLAQIVVAICTAADGPHIQ
jgi:hypothetical protein